MAIAPLFRAVRANHDDSVIHMLETMSNALQAMMTTLRRMPEGCHPEVYYNRVRPYILGIQDVNFRGTGKRFTLHGETGAQSSIIPALVRALGVQHHETDMTKYLVIMQDYMPKPHRDFISSINQSAVRNYILANKAKAPLRDAYNATLEHLLAFRRLHLRFAASYIANQSSDTIGTGGTVFMTWLQQLITETEQQLIR